MDRVWRKKGREERRVKEGKEGREGGGGGGGGRFREDKGGIDGGDG